MPDFCLLFLVRNILGLYVYILCDVCVCVMWSLCCLFFLIVLYLFFVLELVVVFLCFLGYFAWFLSTIFNAKYLGLYVCVSKNVRCRSLKVIVKYFLWFFLPRVLCVCMSWCMCIFFDSTVPLFVLELLVVFLCFFGYLPDFCLLIFVYYLGLYVCDVVGFVCVSKTWDADRERSFSRMGDAERRRCHSEESLGPFMGTKHTFFSRVFFLGLMYSWGKSPRSRKSMVHFFTYT